VDIAAAHIAGIESIGHADQLLAGCHLCLTVEGDAQPQVTAVDPRSGCNRAGCAQSHIEQSIRDRNGLGLIPERGTARLEVIDGKSDGVIIVSDRVAGQIEQQTLVVERARRAALHDVIRNAGG